jgi:hypothetical protein
MRYKKMNSKWGIGGMVLNQTFPVHLFKALAASETHEYGNTPFVPQYKMF